METPPAEIVRIVIVDEHTMAQIHQDTPDRFTVIAPSVIRGSNMHWGEWYFINNRTIRPAKNEDFENFRVQKEQYDGKDGGVFNIQFEYDRS